LVLAVVYPGVTINGLHPGAVATEIFQGVPWLMKIILGIVSWPFLVYAYEGTQTTLHVAISKKLEGVTGKYFADCKAS